MPTGRVRRFRELAQRAEAFLFRAVVLVLLLVLVGQSLVRLDSTRSLFSYVYRLEGIEYDLPASGAPDAVGATFMQSGDEEVLTVTLLLISRPSVPEARLLVDGFTIADFSQSRVTIEVHPGNHLELDSRGIPHGLLFRVVDASPTLLSPQEGDEMLVQDERRTLTIVKTRSSAHD